MKEFRNSASNLLSATLDEHESYQIKRSIYSTL